MPAEPEQSGKKSIRSKDNLLTRLIAARIRAAKAESDAMSLHPNAPIRGAAREILATRLLAQLLPPTMTCMTGSAIDHKGRRYDPMPPNGPDSSPTDSNEKKGERISLHTQDDVLIVDSEIVPPIMLDDKMAIVPWEAVLGRVEVKSKLTKEGLRHALRASKQMFELERPKVEIRVGAESRLLGVIQSMRREGSGNAQAIAQLELMEQALRREQHLATSEQKTFQAVFAFDFDAPRTKSPVDWLNEIQREEGWSDPTPLIGAICVLGVGHWGWLRRNDGEFGWERIEADDKHSESIAFFASLHSTLKRYQSNRRGFHLSQYLLEEYEAK